MQLSDFHFDLPQENIAQFPLDNRTASRLFCLSKKNKDWVHRNFAQILDLIEPGDLLVVNETKVIRARLFAAKKTGGKAEILVERLMEGGYFLAQIRVSKPPKIGDQLFVSPEIALEVIDKQQQFYKLFYSGAEPFLKLLERVGDIPLPPYISRKPTEADALRYQTVYAKHDGSVAAPTAGLHFDETLLAQLKKKGVCIAYLTLHVGAGTFLPVRAQNIKEHRMHAEYIEISTALCEQVKATKAKGKRVIAVGTTSLRALETASKSGVIEPFVGDTDIFIYPGFEFHCVDALITNFHLPCSTLLMLVCAFGGYELVMQAYAEAVQKGYRFYSYGDAMWVG